MDVFEQGVNRLKTEIENGRSVVLFGAGFLGVNTHFYAKALNMNVVGFCDNDIEKIGEKLCGLRIHSLDEAIESFSNPVFIICSSHAHKTMCIQLNKRGITQLFSWLLPYYMYIIQKTKRLIDSKQFAQVTNMRIDKTEALIFSSIAFRITQICNLNCKNCFYFVPYDMRPIHYEKDLLLKSLISFMDSVEAVEMIGLTGGEPFLHPDLGDILIGMAKCSKIIQINITTNGTIVPKPEVLEIIAENGIIIQTSNYGAMSSKMSELERECARRGILHLISPMSLNWFKPQTIERFNHCNAKKKELFHSCSVRRYCDGLIEYGNFESCAYVSRRVSLGMIPRDSNCHVNLINENSSVRERQEKILALTKKDFLSYCDYCDTCRELVPAGEQAEGKIKYKKYYDRRAYK